MGFEELFDTRGKHSGNYRDDRSPGDSRYSDFSRRTSHGEGDQVNWLTILEKIKSNKKLRILVILAGITLLTVVILLIVVLLPGIIKLINSIGQTGLQGILNNITGFIDKILNGTSK